MAEEEQKFGRESVEQQQGITQLEDPRKDQEVKTYGSDTTGLQDAAADLAQSRADATEFERHVALRGPEIERFYHAGEEEWERKKSIKFDRAVRDLSDLRSSEVQAATSQVAAELQAGVDGFRTREALLEAGYTPEAIAAAFAQPQQQAQQQAQPQPELQQPQPESPVTPGRRS